MRKRFSAINGLKLFTIVNGDVQTIGTVTDLLLEDGSWNVRYLVVQIVAPLFRRVLISPSAIANVDFEKGTFSATLSSQQVVDSPQLDDVNCISREYEKALAEYYSWPIYWLGRSVLKPQTLDSIAADSATENVEESSQSNLRSAAEICGYSIQSQNGPAGSMEDLVVHLEKWTVDYATANSASWLASESSMFSTSKITEVDWTSRQVQVDLRQEILQPVSSAPAITGEPLAAQPYRTV